MHYTILYYKSREMSIRCAPKNTYYRVRVARKKKKARRRAAQSFSYLIESSSGLVLMDVSDNRDGDSNNVRKPLAKGRQESGVIIEITNRLGNKESAEEGVSCTTEVSSVDEAHDQRYDGCKHSNYLIAADEGDRVKRIHNQYVDRECCRRTG